MSFAGRELQGYKIHTLVGRGGMGEVYKATHVKTGRSVAIKVLIHERGIDRFRNEARLQANVEHPNVAKLYDLVEFDTKPALILEFVEGHDLDEYLRQNPLLSVATKLNIYEQIVAAVAHLHRLHITHRDIKPSNIKVMANGHVKLIDFGIAKGVTSPTITASGQTVGTLDYMSPERLNGQNTMQSDLWSLGVILYEMMVGKHPFKSTDDFTTRRAISKGEYVRFEKMPNVTVPDQKIGGIIAKCFQLSPDRRFKDAGELHEGLSRFMRYGSRLSLHTNRPGIKMGGKKTIWLIGAAFLFLAVAIGYLIGNSGPGQNGPKVGPGTEDLGLGRTVDAQNGGGEDIELTINTNIAGEAFVVLPDQSTCPVPCTLKRPEGTELNIRIQAEGYKTNDTRLQFLKNGSKTFTLRKN